MPTSLIDADSLLTIDVGSVTTRALIFDVVDGRYRFIAAGSAPTTATAPYHDIGEGVRQALDQLQSLSGRILIGSDEHLILPSKPDGSGVDTCVATLSVGNPLKVAVVGLLEDVSLESAQRLAVSTYAQVVEKITLTDRRKSAARLDALVRARPDVIIVTGGTEGGASQSVMNLLEAVGLACYLIPKDHRPDVLYAGNSKLVKEVESSLSSLTRLSIAPNVRPTIEEEQLAPAHARLAKIYRGVRSRNLSGVAELDSWTGGRLLPTATAFGRVVRFLSRVYDPAKGVLGVDVGASATTVAAAFGGDLNLGVYPELGLGALVPGIMQYGSLEEITRWLSVDISDADVRNYVYNKTTNPASVPDTPEALAIEQALARRALQIAVRKLAVSFPEKAAGPGGGRLPWFEPIVAAGSIFTQAPTNGQSLLMLLDSLQPTGITTLVLDQNNLASSLGAAAEINSILPIQLLESTTFVTLGTVISPVGKAQLGTSILRAKITYENGNETSVEVKHGALEVIPLPMGQPARIRLQPLNRFDVGMGAPGRGGEVKVVGGMFGVIIDARGRPLRLPVDPGRRRELFKKWLWTFGG